MDSSRTAGTAEALPGERPRDSQRDRRNRSIQKAVSTSLASKLSTLVLQFGSLPIAARVLGREEFGIYATVSTALVLVAMLQFGVGPALAKGISEASTAGDRKREAIFYRHGALLLGILVLAGLAIVGSVIEWFPVATLFGESYAPWESEMRSALRIGALLMAGQLLVAHTDRVREGYMEAATVNASSAIGNLVAAAAVAIGIGHAASIEFLLLAIFLPNLLARLLNTVLLLRERPHLVSGSITFDRKVFGTLLRDGISFSATSFLVHTVEFGLCALLVGRILGPGEVAVFLILKSLSTSFRGLLTMVGTPLWAALIDAKGKRDIDWMQGTVRRYRLYLLALVGAAAAVLVGAGPVVLPLYYGEEFTVDRAVFVAHAIFLAAAGWRLVHRTLAIGLGLLPRTVAPILGGLGLEIAFGGIGLILFSLPGLFLGLAAGILLLPGWILPRRVARGLVEP